MKLRFITQGIAVLFSLFMIGVFIPFDAIAQKVNPRDLRENLRLIEAFDSSQEERYQTVFTEKSELFLVTKNRLTNKWSYRKGSLQKQFSPCSGSLYFLGVLNSDANILAVSCLDWSIETWNLDDAKRITRFQVQKPKDSGFLRPYISGDGRRILLTFAGIVEYSELWDAANGRKIAALTSESTSFRCNRTVYSANGFSSHSKIAVVSFGGMTFLWDAETGKLLHRLVDAEDSFYGLNIMTHGAVVSELLFNRNGKIVITAAADGATAWNAETGELLQRFRQIPAREVYSLALSPDEKIIATGGYSRNIRMWDFETGKLLWKSSDVNKTVRELFFSPDGKKILSRTDDRVTIWEAATGKPLEQIAASEELFPNFSPDWRLVTMYDKKTKTTGLYEYLGK